MCYNYVYGAELQYTFIVVDVISSGDSGDTWFGYVCLIMDLRYRLKIIDIHKGTSN